MQLGAPLFDIVTAAVVFTETLRTIRWAPPVSCLLSPISRLLSPIPKTLPVTLDYSTILYSLPYFTRTRLFLSLLRLHRLGRSIPHFTLRPQRQVTRSTFLECIRQLRIIMVAPLAAPGVQRQTVRVPQLDGTMIKALPM